MTASLRRTVIVTMAALGVAFLLVWAASSGPSGVVGGRGVTTSQSSTRPTTPPQRNDSDVTHAHDVATTTTREHPTSWVQDLLGLVLILSGVWLVGLFLGFLVRVVGPRVPEKELVLDLEPLPDVGAAREALAGESERLIAALTAGEVRNGIVACWVLLEETAAGVGVVRRPAETATELVVRFLHALDVDPRPVAGLAALYHEARFSTHPMTDADRGAAEHALEDIQAEVARGVPDGSLR